MLESPLAAQTEKTKHPVIIIAGNILVHKHEIHERTSAAGSVVTPKLMYILIMNTALFEEML